MKKFLSIDLDFWNLYGTNGLLEFLVKVKNSNKPIKLADSHEELLSFINKDKYDSIINVDYHSDIANNDGNKVCELNCGTWANHLKYRNSFLWVHPFRVDFEDSLCHSPQTDKFSPFVHPDIAGYSNVTKLGVRRIPSWIFNDVTSIGIAISYEWLSSHMKDRILSIARKVFDKIPKANPKAILH